MNLLDKIKEHAAGAITNASEFVSDFTRSAAFGPTTVVGALGSLYAGSFGAAHVASYADAVARHGEHMGTVMSFLTNTLTINSPSVGGGLYSVNPVAIVGGFALAMGGIVALVAGISHRIEKGNEATYKDMKLAAEKLDVPVNVMKEAHRRTTHFSQDAAGEGVDDIINGRTNGRVAQEALWRMNDIRKKSLNKEAPEGTIKPA